MQVFSQTYQEDGERCWRCVLHWYTNTCSLNTNYILIFCSQSFDCLAAKDPRRETLAKELEEEENTLRKSLEKLKSVEESRTTLVKHLREALREQVEDLFTLARFDFFAHTLTEFCLLGIWVRESSISDTGNELFSTILMSKKVFKNQHFLICCLVHQVAQEQTGEAQKMQKRLNTETPVNNNNNNNGTSGQSAKLTPASIAAMLTASTNSSMIMQSVLSSFAAEATQTSGLSKSNGSETTNAFPPPPNPQQQQQQQQYHHIIPNQTAPPQQQFLPYGFGNIPLMPPPPPPHMMSSNQSNAAQQQPQQGQSFQPPSMMYYGPPHHS